MPSQLNGGKIVSSTNDPGAVGYPHAKTEAGALARRPGWLERCPVHQKVASSVPGQSTYLGGMFDPRSGCLQETKD